MTTPIDLDAVRRRWQVFAARNGSGALTLYIHGNEGWQELKALLFRDIPALLAHAAGLERRCEKLYEDMHAFAEERDHLREYAKELKSRVAWIQNKRRRQSDALRKMEEKNLCLKGTLVAEIEQRKKIEECASNMEEQNDRLRERVRGLEEDHAPP